MQRSFDVVVVGGGPVGVAMAMMCARRGLSSVVLEKATEVYDLPRAIVMDDEVQRALVLGGADGLAAVTSPLPGAEFVGTDRERIIGIDLPSDLLAPSGYHPVVRYYQPELEGFLRERALAAGVVIDLGVEVTGVEQSADGVVAHTAADGVVAHTSAGDVRGRWLVAADGAASPIRKQLGIAFEDQGFDQDWLVVDLEVAEDRDVPTPLLVQQICDPARPTTFVPGIRRYRRWEFQLQPGETRDEMTAPERVWELVSPWMGPDDGRIVRAVVYRFHATVAASMRAGRIFLAGDAAHQMPPFLGQGLCAGVRDAANLSWKLAMVAQGRAGDGLLDTYDVERRPHAAGVVEHAADTGRLIDQLSGRVQADVGLDSAYGGQRPFPHLEEGLLAGDHPFTGRQVPDVAVGGSTLDRVMGDGFAVVTADPAAFEGPGLARWREHGAMVVETAGLQFGSAPTAVVVRPDRNVAAVASTAAELDAVTSALLVLMS